MVASGVPVRNGDAHASEICYMALALLDTTEQFTINDNPDEHIELRIGIHSGESNCFLQGLPGTGLPPL